MCVHICIKVFERRAGLGYRQTALKCYSFKHSYTTKKLKNKAILSSVQHCVHCFVVLSDLF